MRLPPGWTAEKRDQLRVGIPVFISDLVGEDEIRFEADSIVFGCKVDVHVALFHLKLTENDRQFLRSVHVSIEIKSAYQR